MHQLRNAVLALLAIAPVASAQRAANTSGQKSETAFEMGVDVASLRLGLEAPKSMVLSLGGQPLVGLAWFTSDRVAIEPRVGWTSVAREKQTGASNYALDIGVLYGFSSMTPTNNAWYVRPSVMITGGSAGTRSFTTLSGGFGNRRMFHGMIMHNEISLNRQLESGPVAAATYIQLRHGFSLRRQ
ncbi:MAG TPA: hypothetical protein VF483_11000 [Gemmatimonadaceae bacterium]